MKKVFFIFAMASLILLAACQTILKTDAEFRSMCQANKHMWMLMEPMKGGVELGNEVCLGCMPDGDNHICSREEYIEYMQNYGMTDEQGNMTGTMEAMEHREAMAAHAGMADNIVVHLYNVKFNQSKAEAGKEALLEFMITEKETGKAITQFEIMHEKPMHLVLVRKDLKYFDHIHPMLKGDSWVVPYAFKVGGDYRLWADFTSAGTQHIVDFDLNVAGSAEIAEPEGLNGLQVNMEKPDRIITGKNTELKFSIADLNGNSKRLTEKFLAAAGHLVIIDETLGEFMYSHDESFDRDNTLSFSQTFSKSGRHKAWVQFMADGNANTAEFEFLVG